MRHTVKVLADEQATPEQITVFRRMTPEQRWRAARDLYWTARKHKAAFLRSLHPDWTDEEVQAETRRLFANARA